MRAFDFDGTLYPGDSTLEFWAYALRRCPVCLLALPRQLVAVVLFAMGRIGRDGFKGRFLSFLRHVPNAEVLAREFWEGHLDRLKPDVVLRLRPGDAIVSASPTFLLRPVAEVLGVVLVATEVDPATGELLSPNCRGVEKVGRCKKAGLSLPFEEAYSDSDSDAPLIAASERGFRVGRGGVRPWE